MSHLSTGFAKKLTGAQNIVEQCKKITGAQNIVEQRNMSSRNAKYQGAVQNIGAVPGNQKQDSIN